MGSALVFSSLVPLASRSWPHISGRAVLGVFGSTTTEFAVRDWQSRAWSTAVAVILWLVWFFS